MRARSRRPVSPSRRCTRPTSTGAAANPMRSGSLRGSRCTRSTGSSTSCTATTTASTGTPSRRSSRRLVREQERLLLEIADDELILGWRDSEWTGIAPFLEEDVAFSSIAQNEIGHARALYELVARKLGTTADKLAFDRSPSEYRCSALVELRLPEWERTIARHVLYEQADAERLDRLKASDDGELSGLAAKIDREEIYHRLHAEM